MPYLRVYSRGLPIEKKRIIAQRLIEITLHTFQLPPGQRNQVPLEFVTESPLDRLDGHALIPGDADFKLEVDHPPPVREREESIRRGGGLHFCRVGPPNDLGTDCRYGGSQIKSTRVAFQLNSPQLLARHW